MFLAFQENLGVEFPNSSLSNTAQKWHYHRKRSTIPGMDFLAESLPQLHRDNNVPLVSLPSNAVVSSSNVIEDLGILIQAEDPVRVYGLNQRQFTTDAFTALPLNALGTSYRAMTYEGLVLSAGSQFVVVGASDDTQVTITPTVQVGAREANIPFTISLNALQTFQLQTLGADLTGSRITSNKPVAVLSGHLCANVPANQNFCDHLVEQMIPISAWGQEFYTLPLETRQNGDTFRILADEDDTEVTINDGVTDIVVPLSAGSFHEAIFDGVRLIQSNKPVLVAQFSNGGSFDGQTGDPFMMLVPAAEQFLSNYTFSTVDVGNLHFVNIIATAEDADAGAIQLDGVPVLASEFVEVPNSPFKCAKVQITQGVHTMTGPAPFGIYVYGFGRDDSYGYPGGLGISNSDQ